MFVPTSRKVFGRDAVFTWRHEAPELPQRAYFPQLAAGFASESKDCKIPYSRRFPAASYRELQSLTGVMPNTFFVPNDGPETQKDHTIPLLTWISFAGYKNR
ncbi:MAG: hypothetical protein JRI52_03460 [Deltaproteobacteria bacterium]|nr:hypothetical protein [Deltaproteobacteria bacterium]